jgi:hypothetical protein
MLHPFRRVPKIYFGYLSQFVRDVFHHHMSRQNIFSLFLDDDRAFCIKERSSGRFDIKNSILIYGIIQSCQEGATLFQVDEDILIPDETIVGKVFLK